MILVFSFLPGTGIKINNLDRLEGRSRMVLLQCPITQSKLVVLSLKAEKQIPTAQAIGESSGSGLKDNNVLTGPF
jgi:hypothetical protein